MGAGPYWDLTWNVVVGCDPVSTGCDYCFAPPAAWIRKSNPHPAVEAAFRGVARKYEGHRAEWTGRVNELPDRLADPFARRKPRTFYTTLLGDLFHAKVSDFFLAQVFAVIAVTRRHTYLNTTKRHGRMRSLLNDPAFYGMVADAAIEYAGVPGATPWDGAWPLPNLRLAVSVENQATALLRIPALLDTPAAVRWISAEPLLGPIKLWDPEPCDHHRRTCIEAGCWRALDLVVTGGESDSPRAVHPDWVRSLRDQCVQAGVPFWFKQWGGHRPVRVVDAPHLAGGRAIEMPGGGLVAAMIREPGPTGTMRTAVSRPLVPGDRTKRGVMLDRDTFAVKMSTKDAGRELDGRTWDQLPEVPHA